MDADQAAKDEKAREWRRAYYIANKEKLKAKSTAWKRSNKERNAEFGRDYKARNPEKIAAYAEANREKLNEQSAARYVKNKEARSEYGKARYQEKKVEILQKMQVYFVENRDAIRAKQREYKQNKLKTDPVFKLISLCSRRMHHALKGVAAKSAKTIALLGCDGEFLKAYLEKLFTDDMTWENQGKWQIDHHIPISFFDLTKAEHQQKCFHYSNLRPLWAAENRKKWDNIPLKALLIKG